jgi:hypothetical protein
MVHMIRWKQRYPYKSEEAIDSNVLRKTSTTVNKSCPQLNHIDNRTQKRANAPSTSHSNSHPTNLHLRSLSVNISTSTAAIALSRNDLVVVRAKVKPIASPSVEVGLHVDGAADALVLADRPVLAESSGAVDGGLVGPGGDVDVVVAAVRGDAAEELGAGAGVVGSKVLDLRLFVSERTHRWI